MATITLPKTWATGDTLTASDLNNQFTTIANDYNGNITNANIASGAAIDVAKISGTAVNLSSAQTITGAKTFSTAPLLTFGTEAAGDTYYGSADGTINRLAAGAAGAFLTIVSGLPAWATARFKVATFSRDLTAASGNVGYTGVGFQPTQVIFLGVINTAKGMTIGFGNASDNESISQIHDGTMTYDSTCLRIYQASGAIQGAVIASLDSDGFTLTWTKSGSPTGTANFIYLAIR